MAKILVIEDEGPIRENLARFLKLEGYTVFSSENGRLGLEIAIREVPDLFICDVMMPEMDGIEVLDALRSNIQFKQTPFIFLTASTECEAVERGLNHGANAYLTKPFNLHKLLHAVAQQLSTTKN